MVYKDIMSPIEMLKNYDRLPASQIYEPNLVISLIVNSNNSVEYQDQIKDMINIIYKSYSHDGIPESQTPELIESLSDPIPVCQFHTIEVRDISFNILYRENEILLEMFQTFQYTLHFQTSTSIQKFIKIMFFHLQLMIDW